MKVSVEYTPNSFTEVSINNPLVLIGRGESYDLVFSPAIWPSVSRKHAEIRFENGRYVLTDLDSKFGTYLDGIRISKPSALGNEKVIQIGKDGPKITIVEMISASQS